MQEIELNNLSLLFEDIGVEVVSRFKKAMETPFKHNNNKIYDTVATGRTKESAESGINIDQKSANLVFYADDTYFNHIAKGRKAFAKLPPVNRILSWGIDRNLFDDRKSAYAVSRNISIKGIEPKPFLDLVTIGSTINTALNSQLSSLSLNLEVYREQIMNAIIKDVVIYIKQL